MLQRETPAPAPETQAEATPKETPAPATPEAEPAAPEAQPEAEAKPAEEAPAPEAETPPEAQDAPEDGDLSQEESGLDDETKARLSKAIKKRIGKEKARQAELETKLAAAEKAAAEAAARAAEIAQALEAAKPMPVYAESANDPLAKAQDLNALQAEYHKAKTALRDAEALLDQGVPEEGIRIGNDVYTEQDLKAIKRNAKVMLEDSIPAKAQFLQAKQAFTQRAAQEFAYLQDKNSPDYIRHQAAFQALPVLRALPNADYIIGAVLAYEKSKAKSPAAAAAVPAKPKTSVSQVAASAAPAARARENGDGVARRKVESERQALLKKGNLTARETAAYFAL